MIIGSIPFLLLAQTTVNNIFNVLKDHQVRLFLIILIISITMIYYFARNYIEGDVINKLSTISFNTISLFIPVMLAIILRIEIMLLFFFYF